jgi:hypothetical protein
MSSTQRFHHHPIHHYRLLHQMRVLVAEVESQDGIECLVSANLGRAKGKFAKSFACLEAMPAFLSARSLPEIPECAGDQNI